MDIHHFDNLTVLDFENGAVVDELRCGVQVLDKLVDQYRHSPVCPECKQTNKHENSCKFERWLRWTRRRNNVG